MQKEFNDTGSCIPERHYMVDTTHKIDAIIRYIEKGKYFTINRPRQFGKTTTLYLIMKQLFKTKEFLPLRISFEGLGSENYSSQKRFLEGLWFLIKQFFKINNLTELSEFMNQQGSIENFEHLNRFITELCLKSGKQVVLMVDEVDKSCNNQLFLDFLALLRTKYLAGMERQDISFHSVILAGVHDIKTLKTRIRQDDESKYNSPWNIAIDFTIDLSFNAEEIGKMLCHYAKEKNIQPDITAVAEKLFYYTSGYPYLVSKLCKFIDELILPERDEQTWSTEDVDKAFQMIVRENYTTTLFDSLIKNLENQQKLYDNVFNIVINGKRIPFNINVPVINLGYLYGILTDSRDGCKIHNRIYEQRIYSYMMTKVLTSESETRLTSQPEFYSEEGLNIRLILERFQTFMKEHRSSKDEKFLEREGRLLFLSFLRPIINGKGFEFKEPNVSDERRMDIVITLKNNRYVIELKRWYGPKAHKEGLEQLSKYLDMYSLRQGFLLIYDFSKNKEFKQEEIEFHDKTIFAVWV